MNKFRFDSPNGTAFYTSELLEKHGAGNFFSTRLGGVSQGPYKSLNLGIYTGDSPVNVHENMDRVFRETHMSLKNAVYLKQVHGDIIHQVDKHNLEKIRGIEGDGLITAEKGIPIGIFTADCVPILLFDKRNKVAAALHGGWKGTYLKIVKKAIELLESTWSAKPEDIVSAIGPCIGKCCFQIGSDVADKFKTSVQRHDGFYADLVQENVNQLTDSGVPVSNISVCGACTSCSVDTLFSYRKEKGVTGRMGSFIEIL